MIAASHADILPSGSIPSAGEVSLGTTSPPTGAMPTPPPPLALCPDCGQLHSGAEGHVYDYRQEVDDDLTCHICLQPLVSPTDTPCGHTYCARCLRGFLLATSSGGCGSSGAGGGNGSGKGGLGAFCPLDRRPLRPEACRAASLLVRRLLDKLPVACPFAAECGRSALPRGDLADHLRRRCVGMSQHHAAEEGLSRRGAICPGALHAGGPDSEAQAGSTEGFSAAAAAAAASSSPLGPDEPGSLGGSNCSVSGGSGVSESGLDNPAFEESTDEEIALECPLSPMRRSLSRALSHLRRTDSGSSVGPEDQADDGTGIGLIGSVAVGRGRQQQGLQVNVAAQKSRLSDQYKNNGLAISSGSSSGGLLGQSYTPRALGGIPDGEVTTIEVARANPYMELGISVVGGCETPLITVVIQDVFREGAIALDGRLLPGDQILQVNGVDISNVSHNSARAALARPCPSLRLTVLRERRYGTSGTRAAPQPPPAQQLQPAAGQHAPPPPGTAVPPQQHAQGSQRAPAAAAATASQQSSDGGPPASAAVPRGPRCQGGHPPAPPPPPPPPPGPPSAEGPESAVAAGGAGAMDDSLHVVLHKRGGSGREQLGIKLVRCGDDSGVFVLDLLEGGPAAVDGRLRPSDRVLSINGHDLRQGTPEMAAQVIQGSEDRVHIVVSRPGKPGPPGAGGQDGRSHTIPGAAHPSPPKPCHYRELSQAVSCQEKVVTVRKEASESLGMTVAGGLASRSGELPIFVTSVQGHGCLGRDGRIHRGDVLMSVNGVDLTRRSHSEAVAQLKACAVCPVVTLRALEVRVHSGVGAPVTASPSSSSSPPPPPSAGGGTGGGGEATNAEHEYDANWSPPWLMWLGLPSFLQSRKEVILRRSTSGSWGFSIVGGYEENHSNQPFFIKSIVLGTPAYNDGRLKCGDMIVAVNGHGTTGMSHAALVTLLKELRGKVTLTVVSWPGSIL